jgi:hypothetical protein
LLAPLPALFVLLDLIVSVEFSIRVRERLFQQAALQPALLVLLALLVPMGFKLRAPEHPTRWLDPTLALRVWLVVTV